MQDYTVATSPHGRPWGHELRDRDGEPVDQFRTLRSAQHAAGELLAGRATIDPHQPVGCRVVPVARDAIDTLVIGHRFRPLLPDDRSTAWLGGMDAAEALDAAHECRHGLLSCAECGTGRMAA